MLADVALFAAIVAADQATKALVRGRMRLYESHEIIPGLLSLVHGRNPGMAFGIFSGGGLPFQAVVLTVVSLAVLAVVIFQWRRLAQGPALLRLAMVLIAAGAVGNLLDRLRHGYVTDFVHVYWGRHSWPDFNVADSAISIGIVVLLLDAVWPRKP
jgi:signal peptidase II